jgi:hypothetical protein
MTRETCERIVINVLRELREPKLVEDLLNGGSAYIRVDIHGTASRLDPRMVELHKETN